MTKKFKKVYDFKRHAPYYSYRLILLTLRQLNVAFPNIHAPFLNQVFLLQNGLNFSSFDPIIFLLLHDTQLQPGHHLHIRITNKNPVVILHLYICFLRLILKIYVTILNLEKIYFTLVLSFYLLTYSPMMASYIAETCSRIYILI